MTEPGLCEAIVELIRTDPEVRRELARLIWVGLYWKYRPSKIEVRDTATGEVVVELDVTEEVKGVA